MLEFRNVSKIYCNNIDKERRAALRDILWKRRRDAHPKPGEILALDDISFSVEKGRPLVILGASRAGKTAIAKLACRLSQPSSGAVRVGGRARLVNHKGISATPFMSLRHHIYLIAMSYGAGSKDVPGLYDRILGMDEFKGFADVNVKRMPVRTVKKLNYYLGLFIDADIYVFDETFAYHTFNHEPLYKERFEEIIKSRTVLVLAKNITSGLKSLIKGAMVLDKGKPICCAGFEDAVRSYNNLRESEVADNTGLSSLNDSIRSEVSSITSVQLTDADGGRIKPCVDAKGRACIPNTKDLYVNIFCSVSHPGITVSGGVDVYTRGTYVFGGRQPPVSVDCAGVYRLRMMIPSNLLADNLYFLNVSVIAYADSRGHKAALDNALEFRVTSPVEDESSSYRHVISNVLVSPRLDWDIAAQNSKGDLGL